MLRTKSLPKYRPCRRDLATHVVFDVSERLPDVAAGIVAAIVLIAVVVAWLRHSTLLESHWPVVLAVGAGLIVIEGLADRDPVVLGFGVFGAAFGRLATARPGSPDQGAKGNNELARLFARSFVLIGAIFFGLPRIDAIGLSQELAAGRATVIEGTVTVYLEVPLKTECISVAAQRFCYSDNDVTTGFNHTHALGGPMVTGLYVRLYVIRDEIVRVEVADSP